MTRRTRDAGGFTLLEVVVTLTILALGVSLVLSLMSGSLGNIRKVQSRTRIVEHAQTVMELALLDEAIQGATAFTGDFADGTRWSVQVEEQAPDTAGGTDPGALERMPVRLLRYRVEMFAPGSGAPEFGLETLKLVTTAETPPAAPVQP
mgnify:FL=1